MPDWNAHLHRLFGAAVEFDLLRAALAGGLSRPRLAHPETQLRAGAGGPGISHHHLHPNGLVGNLGRHLDPDNVRRPGQNQLDRIEYARDVTDLLKIPSRGNSGRHGFTRGPDANDEFVHGPIAAQGWPRIKATRREAGQMLAQENAIEEHARAVSRL